MRSHTASVAGACSGVLVAAVAVAGEAMTLDLPPRESAALGGRAFAEAVASLPLSAREAHLAEQVCRGNIPGFLRRLSPVVIRAEGPEDQAAITLFVTPDYLAAGSDDDYVLWPMSPVLAQSLADRLDCLLPTPRIVDAIHASAAVRLAPQPIPPSAAMTTVPVFVEHSAKVTAQRAASLGASPLGALVSGHKKDVVLSNRLAATPGKVAIYGWHRPDGSPIQPLYAGHAATWVDYSHGVRLVSGTALLDGRTVRLADILRDPVLSAALSNEGPLSQVRYTSTGPPADARQTADAPGPQTTELLPGFSRDPLFAEQTCDISLDPGVRVRMVAPLKLGAADERVDLVLYALPNGNTIDQTVGRRLRPGDDWHVDIQHIGAQARFLRSLRPGRALAVAYLEASGRSWPAWRRQHGGSDTLIPALVDAVRGRLGDQPVCLTLSGHSGGGSLIFGYLEAVAQVPDEVDRIVFLDSTYAYDRDKGHAAKLCAWLQSSPRHALCVIAYDDSVALLNGRPVVSATGGTWYRSHRMQEDLAQAFAFEARHDGDAERFSALDGRVQFALRRNPKGAILHTLLVERNGFIHSMLTGTPEENRGYAFFGPRAYGEYIAPAPP